ncbi:UDP-sugar pyrophosphorylase 1 [Coccomyxa subellipsoidea C-169]|uniref:UTP-monosaccharide-1-phosphate uridylyltransferase n=1 Tax=Coccomyxa subellipsoidea (strain C-169) TaxID=574566 RepID=I0YVK4_COCSC|nr:UDP-sugar pyrophosphorylase 1 [Coccomyxa subellipsoidea C-169]EIE22423.1 UDP-sugar pyrophosphorylase 1 [Coccomyxa subellipsoidea C-169]|eukprot:XP_005646967.1 UDP-sugar pyrophosphorylase 1 [Coccomyxa subellipsoidea C-169]
MDALNGNEVLLTEQNKELVQQLLDLDQSHLFLSWPPPGEKDNEKQQLLEQLQHLDQNYTGGLATYIKNAKQLLEDSRSGKNAFEGFVPSVPKGKKLDFGSEEFKEFEELGVAASKEAAFVLVAGGLGERLGYKGIKVALPTELASEKCFLQVYIESIRALQAKAGGSAQLPLAIMTSGDTHARTEALLQDNAYFGMQPGQVTLLKQEKVACLSDGEAHLALDANNPFAVQTKPHGHGDVHALLHSSGLLKRWVAAGVRWVAFFQDTNALVFRGIPAALGVSARYGYDMNSLAVPRKAKEAIGGIASLQRPDGGHLTINVEYNLLDPLLRANGWADGDVNDASGYSPFPGNINQLVLKADSYAAALEETEGIIAEFVNPKYKDDSRTAFKSSTRLECMMQDFPHGLPPTAAVGFTVVWAAYSPVKNSPDDARAKAAGGNPSHSATSGEVDIYRTNCAALRMAGARIEGPEPREFNGLSVDLWPRVSWSPFFALTFSDLEAKIDAASVRLSKDAVLVINGAGVRIKSLDLDGTLVIDAAPGAEVVLDGLKAQNRGWKWQALNPNKEMTEEQAMRGFKVCRKGETALKLEYPTEGKYVYPEKADAGKEGVKTERAAVA